MSVTDFAERGLRLAGLMLVMLGVALLCLAAATLGIHDALGLAAFAAATLGVLGLISVAGGAVALHQAKQRARERPPRSMPGIGFPDARPRKSERTRA